MRKHRLLLVILLLSSFNSFAQSRSQSSAKPYQESFNPLAGRWRGVINLKEGGCYFNFEVHEMRGGGLRFTFINGDERIASDEIKREEDSIFIRMPVYDTEIRARIEGAKPQGVFLRGYWLNHARTSDNVVSFEAQQGQMSRFPDGQEWGKKIAGKWEVNFLKDNGDSSKAIGVFEQDGLKIKGTFLSPSGDYRYLEGIVQGPRLLLSSFDGSHAWLFRADLQKDGTLKGHFFSGLHHKQEWVARRNNKAELPDPTKLTFLKEGYEKLDFSFPDLDGRMVSLSDERYKNKVVIVQIMGSWCPNCLDESAFLKDYYLQNKDKGLEIIGLAFERSADTAKAKIPLRRFQQRIGIPYPILLAGQSTPAEAAKALPALNQIMSYPTTIFIDRTGKVRRIHTGYSGPATGEYYKEFIAEFEKFVGDLLREK